MLIPKDMIVERIRATGDYDGAERADRELGEKVDTDRDADVLAGLGVDPGELTEAFGGQAPNVG